MNNPSEKFNTGLTLIFEGIVEAVNQIIYSITSVVKGIGLHKSWEVYALASGNPIVTKRYEIYLRTKRARIKKKQRDMIIRIMEADR